MSVSLPMHHTLLKTDYFSPLVCHLLEVFKNMSRLIFILPLSLFYRELKQKNIVESMDALRSTVYSTGYFPMQPNPVLDLH